MMPDPIILALGSSMMILAVGHRRWLKQFISDCSDMNVERLEREERLALDAMEAKLILSRMKSTRWT